MSWAVTQISKQLHDSPIPPCPFVPLPACPHTDLLPYPLPHYLLALLPHCPLNPLLPYSLTLMPHYPLAPSPCCPLSSYRLASVPRYPFTLFPSCSLITLPPYPRTPLLSYFHSLAPLPQVCVRRARVPGPLCIKPQCWLWVFCSACLCIRSWDYCFFFSFFF